MYIYIYICIDIQIYIYIYTYVYNIPNILFAGWISFRRRGGPGPQPGRGAAGNEIRASEDPWAFFSTFAVTSGNILWKFEIFKFRIPDLILKWHHESEAEMHHESKPNARKRSVKIICSKTCKNTKCATMNARKSAWGPYLRPTWRQDTMIERSAVENHT